jgi:guanine deaminase
LSGAGVRAYRGALLHFSGDPGPQVDATRFEAFDDGLLIVREGRVERAGPAEPMLASLSRDVPVAHFPKGLIVPGFVDAHIHYSQTDVIASAGRHLLHWLEHYTFPQEARFEDPAHGAEVAEFFLDELLRHGTTTALVFGTVHRASVDAFFAAASRRNLRMAAGKVLMDRHGPAELQDTPEGGIADSEALIEAWHGKDRLAYAITPRFAITSSDRQLEMAGALAQRHPTTLVQTHVAENREEVEWARRLFPGARSYLDVYDRHGLLREGAVFAHCIHLDPEDRRRLAQSGATAAFCPTSNLFLGSGLFDLRAADEAGHAVAIATDVGGGTSFSMLRTLGEAYKVGQLLGQPLSPVRAMYFATLAGARALRMDAAIGNFEPGKEADFVVLDDGGVPLLARRLAAARTLEERLLCLMMLGDERSVRATFVMGERKTGSDPAFLA